MRGAFQPIHVLVVEPDATIQPGLAQTPTDLAIETAATANAALDYLSDSQYNCVVAAYALPDRDGLDLLDTLRDSSPTLPFFLVADDGTEKLASQAISADVTDYFQYPTTTDQFERLADSIQEGVGQSRPDQRLQELAAASTDIHWMFSADWSETLFINDAYEEIWGRSADVLEAQPRDFINGVHPDDRERLHTAMDALSAGDSIDIEIRVNEPDDYQRWVWIQGEPIRDRTDEVVRVTGFARDITDRVEHRQQLERTEARFRTLAENFPNGGVHYFDDDLRYQYVSGSGFDPIDTTPEDLVGNTIYEVDPYADTEIELLESLMETTLEGNHETAEIPYEDHIFEVHSVPIHDDEGEVTGGFFITQDVTAQRERERDLEVRSAALEASIDGMAILDGDERYAFVNQAHADIYGYDGPAAFEGNSWRMCYDETECERFETEVMPMLAERGGWRGEAVGTRKDGSTFPQELSLSVTDDDRIICVVRDISDRIQRERQLERQNDRLEEFTSVVSHDLRGPLTVVSGRLNLAQDDCDSPHLEAASESIDRAVELLADLRALAEQGEDVGEVQRVEMASVVEQCWGTIQTPEATLEVSSDRTLVADRSRLRQVFENLFRNAVEHGGEDVTVRVGATDNGFYVADDGPGIPEDERERVFDSGYSTSDSGTGYGLNIVKEIVAAHDWDVSVTGSELGGARFDISGVDFVA